MYLIETQGYGDSNCEGIGVGSAYLYNMGQPPRFWAHSTYGDGDCDGGGGGYGAGNEHETTAVHLFVLAALQRRIEDVLGKDSTLWQRR
jgi:hypothetical protein